MPPASGATTAELALGGGRNCRGCAAELVGAGATAPIERGHCQGGSGSRPRSMTSRALLLVGSSSCRGGIGSRSGSMTPCAPR